MFSARLGLTDLIELCRVLRHQLAAGLTIHQVLRQQAERGRLSIRPIAGRLSEAVEQGSSLADALEPDRDRFPPLFLAMIKLGESSGHLAEIFRELERYFDLELQLRRQYFAQTLWPKVQFVFATIVIAGVMMLLGFLGSLNPAVPQFRIFGLSGTAGAFTFLAAIYGTLIVSWLGIRTLTTVGRNAVWMHWLLLNLPGVGMCFRSLIMSRFSLALQLTLDSGLSITKALRLSLDATGNAFFDSRSDIITSSLKDGKPLHEALEASRLFDVDFINMVASSEEGGRVPEMMRTLAEQYQDETKRRMTMLTGFATAALAVTVGGFIIWAIFSFYGHYFGMLEKFTR